MKFFKHFPGEHAPRTQLARWVKVIYSLGKYFPLLLASLQPSSDMTDSSRVLKIKNYSKNNMNRPAVRMGGGGVLRGKKDRDDRRKSLKTTLKNTKP